MHYPANAYQVHPHAFPTDGSIAGHFPPAISAQIVRDADPLHAFASEALNCPDIFTDPYLSAVPGRTFGSPLARLALGRNLGRHRNLQAAWLRAHLPRYVWRFTGGRAFFDFVKNVERICGYDTLTQIEEVELECDFHDVERWAQLLRIVQALGSGRVDPETGRVGSCLPGLKRLHLSFIVFRSGFQECGGRTVWADERPYLWDWTCFRVALAEVRVREATVQGLKSREIAAALVEDCTGVTRRALEAAGGTW